MLVFMFMICIGIIGDCCEVLLMDLKIMNTSRVKMNEYDPLLLSGMHV
jgi:hypothetical protein